MALDFSNKNDRFLAFSILDIPDNYAIKARFITKKITIFKQETDCNIITDFSVAIRPCELEKIAYILGYEYRINRTKEYWNLMNYFNNGGIPLNKIIELSKKEYDIVMNSIFRDNKKSMLYKIINKSRVYTKQKSVGSNVLKYLLYKLNNKIISLQIAKSSDDSFSKINLSKRTYSFDKAPLSMCPINHVPSFKDLLEVFDFQEHKNEIISRTISLASIDSSCIYLSEERVKTTNLDDIIASYNSQYMKPSLEGRKIMRYGKYLYLNENELNTVNVLKIILNFSKKENFVDYSNFINSKIMEKQFIFTDPIKEAALKRMFDKSSVFIVYGPAGSGKSYFAKYVLNSLEDLNNVCIATTNPAVENMRRKFENSKARYLTITKFLSEYNLFTKIDLLIIDECSAVSTKDINDILTKTKPKLLLLLGDTYQIKPITFGNRFSLLTYFVDCSKYVILNNQYRCDTDSFLLTLRNEVRELKNNIKEYLSSNEISHKLEDENSLFKKESDDEIILCLNYDGLYGINNINRIFQKKNNHKEYKWKQYFFIVGDPIVFNDSTIYKNVFYNNLKGRILHIVENDLNFVFTVKIERNVSSIACAANNINYIGIDGNGTIVSFEIKKFDENYYDNDSTGNTHIPFQIAYALSIHKAQGLEYDSVKIIISNEVEENITHSVFYTAITRAKRILNIYWTPETEEKIISNFYIENCKIDANILKAKYQELKA